MTAFSVFGTEDRVEFAAITASQVGFAVGTYVTHNCHNFTTVTVRP